MFTIRVDIPALDKLVAFLQAKEQAKVDAITEAVTSLSVRLQVSNAALQDSISTEQKNNVKEKEQYGRK